MLKKSTLLLAVSLLICFISFSQWEWLNPKPSGYTCNKITFTDSLNGFILNSNGDLLSTNNQGANWNFKQNFPNVVTMDIAGSNGIISGYFGTVYITTDKGNTWQRKTTTFTDYLPMADMVTRDTMFVANNNGKIYRTDDGGNTWKTFNCGIRISSIEFVNSKVGYAGGSDAFILKTEDGGATWQKILTVNFTPSNTLAIKFIDVNTGFAFREHSTILKTIDGGKTWEEYRIGDKIYSIYFLNNNIGFASGEHGVMYRTDDRGATWKWIGASARIYAYDLNSIFFLNESTGFSVGSRGRILKTTDGGTSWNTYSPTYIDVSDISFPTNSLGYAIAGDSVYKTIDGGSQWKALPLASRTSLKYCHFLNADTGFVTAEDWARVYKTFDGGATWNFINVSPYRYDYVNGIHFLNGNVGYLAVTISGNARIVKTVDCGTTWTDAWAAQYQGEAFHKIFFNNEKTGYASRYEKLFKTEDSAKTWKELWGEEFNDISAIEFVNPKIGFVGGNNGMLKMTNDSGNTWKKISLANQFYDDIYDIKFFNEKVGYITAENGVVYKTIDGGTTWKQNGTTKFFGVYSINFAPDSTVYLVGQYGTIARSNVSEHGVSSLNIYSTNNCEIQLSARVSATLTSVDSISFEYGINNFDNSIVATPASINNEEQTVQGSVSNLPPGKVYKSRLKYYYRGKFYYTNEQMFITPDRPSTPVITASGSTTFCDGENVQLNSSATTGNQWFLNGSVINTATSQSFTASKSGKYQVVTSIGCYPSDTATVTVTVNPVPAKPIITASANILSSSAATGNQWYLDGTSITGATEKQYVADKNGQYAVKVSENSCTSLMSDTLDFVVPGSNIITYPNPVTNNVIVRNTVGQRMVIQVADGTGNVLYKVESISNSHTINMSNFASGNYFIKVKFMSTGETSVKMVVKQ